MLLRHFWQTYVDAGSCLDVQIFGKGVGVFDCDLAAVDIDDAFVAEAGERAGERFAGHAELAGKELLAHR